MTSYKVGMAEEAVIADLTAKLAECKAQKEAALRIAEQHSDVVNNMIQQLTESQAREARLREALDLAKGRMMTLSACVFGKPDACKYMVEALALPADDTALKGYRKKLLDNYLEVMRNVFEEQGMDWPLFETLTTELRRMAEG